MEIRDKNDPSKDRRRFLRKLTLGAGLAAPALVTLSNRKLAVNSGGPTPTPTSTQPPP